ncbi:YcaO-like family protein [Patescibacteria group bacterium]|nr:YcaO-like family protein [Patescibacteria group bacterium]
MILDAAAFSDVQDSKPKHIKWATTAFLELLEQKLGVRVVFDRFNFPYGKTELTYCFELAQKMVKMELIKMVRPVMQFQDEPRLKMWVCGNVSERKFQTGGASLDDEEGALMAALAESLERQIWRQDDYFVQRIYISESDMQRKRIPHTPLQSFASFTPEQRNSQKRLQFNENTKFLWVKGVSLVSKKNLHVPAQAVSSAHNGLDVTAHEPLIRVRSTNGLATWPTQIGARLAGVHELVERDAYMIMWLNQLTLARLDITPLLSQHPTLMKFVRDLERYRFRIHCIPMLTDAPTYAMATVIEDMSGKGPRFTIGLKAHRSLVVAIEKSATEAMRARYAARLTDYEIPDAVSKVGHYDRVPYWAREGNAKKLEFLISGEMKVIEPQPWDNDSEESHYERIIEWLRSNDMEAVSVPLTHSKKNVSKFHIEMVVIPKLHALHLSERDLAFGGERWQSVPKMFGVQPRKEMFTAEPHPFA